MPSGYGYGYGIAPSAFEPARRTAKFENAVVVGNVDINCYGSLWVISD